MAGLIMDSSGNLYGTTRMRRRSERRHGFRAGPGQRHDHHAGFVQRHQRCIPGGRPDHGQQRQPVRHNGVRRRLRATARFSSWPTAAARSPRWPRSTATNGDYPQAALIMDSSGNLYGTTYGGSASAMTARFSSWPRAAAPSPRWLRSTAPTVPSPEAGLIMDSSGNLYGTTESGGVDDDGTVFELAKGSGTITTLASFNGTNGADPTAGLIMDSSGNLYGTTELGGAYGDGTVFELSPNQPTQLTITATSGSGQSTPVSTAYPNPLVVTVTDQSGGQVPNVTVTFTAPASGPSGTFSNGTTTITGVTNASGQVEEAFTANGQPGSYTVTASVPARPLRLPLA